MQLTRPGRAAVGSFALLALLLPCARGQEKNKVVVEGRIQGIAEIDPPRLYLKVGGARQTVVVPLPATKLSWKGQPFDFNTLRENDRIRVRGRLANPGKSTTVTAEEIEVLERH